MVCGTESGYRSITYKCLNMDAVCYGHSETNKWQLLENV